MSQQEQQTTDQPTENTDQIVSDDKEMDDFVANIADQQKESDDNATNKSDDNATADADTQNTETHTDTDDQDPDQDTEDESVYIEEAVSQYGMTKETATKYAEAGVLEDTLNMLYQNRPAQQAAPPEAQEAEAAQPIQEEGGFKKLELKFDEDEFDPAAIKVMNTITDHFNNQVEGLQKELSHYKQLDQQKAQKAMHDTIDEVYNSQEGDIGKILGQGSIEKMRPTSPSAIARGQVDVMIDNISGLPQNAGKSIAEITQTAINIVFSDKVTKKGIENNSKSIKKKLAKRKGTRTQKPSTTKKADKIGVKTEEELKDEVFKKWNDRPDA